MAMTPGGGGGGPGRRPAVMAEINVTPLVDVMLVLLVIFMVAAPLMMTGVPVQLPRTAAAKLAQPRKPLIVSIARDGGVYLRDERVAEPDLASRLAALRAEVGGDTVVYVRGDRGIEYGRVMGLLGEVGRAGFAKVSLIAEAPPGGGRAP